MLKYIAIILFAVFSLSISNAQNVPTLKQSIELKIDELGNATMSVSMKMTASQWDYFKKTTALNLSSFKRTMEMEMPKYYLTDFKVDQDEMERTVKVHIKALGVVTLDKNGKWIAELETKDPDISKLTDRTFLMTSTLVTNGGLIEQTQKIFLPDNAKNGKIEKDSFGKAVLTYKTGGSFLSTLPTILGVILILAGFGMWWRGRNTNANTVPAKQSYTQPRIED
ncbi:MAG TPA: hypothetical protein PLE75_08340 [Ferruginibacter sp.]|nr:hypothetical protein [Chitinophagaceae bacterium]HML56923.1 hypothetical protein [Ferruginibacter sp.]HRN92101.1 hypothetical protein [Ferruginibacter sp.]HRO06677.1 hypothetical protein [Ferruginibacter sp.]HRO97074.1 hypothetical protein [Ferruginibacter sp.]